MHFTVLACLENYHFCLLNSVFEVFSTGLLILPVAFFPYIKGPDGHDLLMQFVKGGINHPVHTLFCHCHLMANLVMHFIQMPATPRINL